MNRRELLRSVAVAALIVGATIENADALSGSRRLLFMGGRKSVPFVPLSASAFDLNFATGQASVASLANLSCTRAQTVTSYVTNADGTVTACAANTLRIGTGTGLLIEESRKNILVSTEDLTAAAWGTSLTGSGSLSVAAPTNTNLSAGIGGNLITVNRSSVSDQAERFQTFTGTAATYSGGFFVKAATTADIGKQIAISFFNGSVATFALIILTGAIQRIPITSALLSSASCNLGIGYLAGFGLTTGSVSFYAGGAQSELGVGLSSYIPNTGVTQNTRSADVVTSNGIVLTTYQSSAATLFAKVINVASSVVSDRIVGFNASPGPTPAFKTSATTLEAYNGTSVTSAATIGNGISFATLGGVVNVVSSYAAGSLSVVANGGAEITAALSMPAITSVFIGSDGGAVSFLNGYIARLAGWNTQLVSATRIALSATFNTTSLAIGGVNTNYLVPNNVPLSGTFVMYHHGAGETETAWTSDALKFGTRESLLAQGHILSASAAAGDNWGNTAGLNAYAAQWTDVQTRYAPSKLVFYSQSMGGETGLLTIAAATMPVRGWYGVFPACNLAEEYSLSFTTAINTAYNIPGGGTYAVQTAGHDPVLLSGSLFTIRMRFTGSTADGTVPVTQNAVQMQTLVSPTALESFLLQSIGAHGDTSNFIPSDVVSFFARC